MWLERNRLRRQEEMIAKNQPMLRRIATPTQLTHMTYEEGMMAVSMNRQGGQAWSDWMRLHPGAHGGLKSSGSLPSLKGGGASKRSW